MLLYYLISLFTFEIFYIYLACGKKYENESFTSYFGASVLADEVVMIAQCAGSLKRAMINLICGYIAVNNLMTRKRKVFKKVKGNALSNYYR